MIQRRRIVAAVTRARLLELARIFEVSGLSGKPKKEIVQAISAKRSVKTRTLLESMKREELKAACRAVGLDDGGRAKAALIARLMGEKNGQPEPPARQGLRVLLVEPDYRAKFPPLGLLKIGTYHRSRGDEVRLVRGVLKDAGYWDRVYVTSLFSFHHRKTIDTILHYKRVVGDDLTRIFVGGVYATLFPKTIFKETGVWPLQGRINRPNLLGLGDHDATVDGLIPDYSLLGELDYDYGLDDCYFGYATRGCVNRCPFCAVPQLEPEFEPYTGLREYVQAIAEKFGERQNLVLMDNNVLASNQFERIIQDIIDLGFQQGAKRNGKKRVVDFNQGLDARFITRAKARLLATICLQPVRIAYDHVAQRKRFEHAVTYLADEGLTDLSTYVLFNYNDTPADLYKRLRHCIDLNERLGIKIWSFPMRYTPLNMRDRSHLAPHWNRRQLRGLQCILNVAKGLVSHRADLFLRAFGESPDEFDEISAMPEHYVLQRDQYEDNEAAEWRTTYRQLTERQRNEFLEVASVSTKETHILQEAHDLTKSKRLKKLWKPFLSNGRSS